MSDFKSYRFGNVEVYQTGSFGTAHSWMVARNGTIFEAASEIAALQLGMVLAGITDKQWHEVNVRALSLYSKREAA